MEKNPSENHSPVPVVALAECLRGEVPFASLPEGVRPRVGADQEQHWVSAHAGECTGIHAFAAGGSR